MKQEAFQRAKEIEKFITAHKAAVKNLTHELKYIKELISKETQTVSNEEDDDRGILSAIARQSSGNVFEYGFYVTGVRLGCTGNSMHIEPKIINDMYLLQIQSHEAKIAAYYAEFDRL